VRALSSRATAVCDQLTSEAVTELLLSRKIDPDLAHGQQFPRNSQEWMQARSDGGGSDSLLLESHILSLQSQVDVLTREVLAGQVPPMYEEAS
jgi:hypothetical protein